MSTPTSNVNNGFYVAPFGIDGESEGVGFWEFDRLSSRWLAICTKQLDGHGPTFEASWPFKLAHISTRFTSTPGIALATFKVRGRIAASLALTNGLPAAAETDILQMFVESLRQVQLVKATGRPRAFEKVLALKERPLMVVVPWPDPSLSDDDHEAVRELGIHLAAGFLAKR
jgi:hypothetical protein